MPRMKAFGFLIGEPERYHTKRSATAFLINRYALRDKKIIVKKEEVIVKEKGDDEADDKNSGSPSK